MPADNGRRRASYLLAAGLLIAVFPAAVQAGGTTSAPPIDWAQQLHRIPCGAGAELVDVPLVGGFWADPVVDAPAEGSVLNVSFVGATAIPGQPGVTAVNLACVAGGPGAHLSTTVVVLYRTDGPQPVELLQAVVQPTDDIAVGDDGSITLGSHRFSDSGNDPMCCPSWYATQTITWVDGAPVLNAPVVHTAEPFPIPVANSALTGPLSDCEGREVSATTTDTVLVAALQTALQGQGYDLGVGGVSGQFDEATRLAMVTFAHSHGPGSPNLPNISADSLSVAAADSRADAELLTAIGVACVAPAPG